jgi:hypothetical protein
VNPVTNSTAAKLPPYLRQARLQGFTFTLANPAVALTRLQAGFAAPHRLDQVGTTYAAQATRYPS